MLRSTAALQGLWASWGGGKFNCLASSMQEWLVPAGQKISEEDKKMIIQRITEKTAGSHLVFSFDNEKI